MDRRFQYLRKRLLKIIIPGLKRLPPRTSAAIVSAFGPIEYALNGGLRARYHEGIARTAAHLGVDWEPRETALALSRNLALWMTRDLLLDGWPDAAVESLFQIEGREHLDESLAGGKGAILLFSHFGAHIHSTHWLMRNNYTVRWFTERSRSISKILQRDFDTAGPTGQSRMFITRKAGPSESAAALLRAARALDAGLIVKVAGDVRWAGARAMPGRFLGRTYNFTCPWLTLASLTGAPVVPVFCVMKPDGTVRMTFDPAYHVPDWAREDGRGLPWVQAHLDRLEEMIKLHPDNSNDYFFWHESDEYLATGPVTDAQRSAA